MLTPKLGDPVMDRTTDTWRPNAGEFAVTTEHTEAENPYAARDITERIRMLESLVTKRTETEYEHAERLRAQIFPEAPIPRTHWRVDWLTVRGAERWLREEWAPMQGWKVIGRKLVGNLMLSAQVEVPPPETSRVLAEPGPPGARNIHGVLLSRCAGYALVPKAEDIVKGIESERPNEMQTRAILSYLREASESEVDAAWKANEFSLMKLMACVDRRAPHDSLRGLSSVLRWLKVEEIR